MAQSFGIPKSPAQLDKGTITKFGPVVGGALSLFGMLIVAIGFVLPWVKIESVGLSGLDILTKNGNGIKDAVAITLRGSSYNGLLCNLPLFLCGSLILALLLIAGTFWKKMPAQTNRFAPILLALFTLFSCCPTLMLVFDLQKDRFDGVKTDYGYWIALFGLAVVLLGAVAGVVAAIMGGGFPKRKKVM